MIQLETPRLILRDYRPEDEADYIRLKSDEKTMFYLQDIRLRSPQEGREDFAAMLEDQASPGRTFFFLRAGLKATGEQIGSIGYTVIGRGARGKIVDAGYFFSPQYWNQGYGTEAMKRVLAFAFEEDEVFRVTTGCLAENRGSKRIMEKCGMVREGEFPFWEYHDNQLKTRLQYRLLREEYLSQQERPSMFAVAIDGPAGAGKTSVAKAVAQKLGFLYVDTGAMYRTVALALLRAGIDPKDRPAVEAALPDIRVEVRYEDGRQKQFLCGEDVSDLLRGQDMGDAASACSAIPAVRQMLLEPQRELARHHNVIMDGRDIGTVVLPDAPLKLFYTAAPEERARRRWEQLRQTGKPDAYETVLAEVLQRDHNDSTRDAAPMRQAEDALLLDTTNLDFDGAVAAVLRLIEERGGPHAR